MTSRRGKKIIKINIPTNRTMKLGQLIESNKTIILPQE